MQNIHATCIKINQKGVLILGKSGSGKSDLALRLIENKNAVLVADDRVNLEIKNNKIMASAPENLKGLLEIRGLGIVHFPCTDFVNLNLVVQLCAENEKTERMPDDEFYEFEGLKIPLVYIHPFEASAIDKIVIKLKAGLD